MRIRRYLVTVAFKDRATDKQVSERAVEDALEHGLLEETGAMSVKFMDERVVEYPDPLYANFVNDQAYDQACDEWDGKAEDEVFGNS